MTINLSDYAHTAAQRGWGAGWPSCSGAAGNLVKVTFTASGVAVSVHQRIARLFLLLANETERRGYLAKLGQTGSYNCRAIAGTNSPSNHSWGLACDWNWTDNPFTTNYALNHVPAWMAPLWNRYGFAWGGAYTGKKDFMHWEFMGTPADADAMTALALYELGNGSAPLPATTTEDDVSMTPIPVVVTDDGHFGIAVRTESAADTVPSQVASAMWIRFGPVWGAATDVQVGLQDGKGGMLQPVSAKTPMGNNVEATIAVPRNCRQVTIEGALTGADKRRQMSAWLLVKPV